MAELPMSNSGTRRSAVYSYLRPVISGRRVLEVGCGTGEAAEHLLRLGAKTVVGAGSARDIAQARSRHHDGALAFVTMTADAIDASGAFDVVLVPDAASVLRGHGPVQLSTLIALVAPDGQLACVVPNGDRGDGVPYYDVVDALAPHFPKVRMFGQTPFAAYGIAEFDEAAADLRVDSDLAERESEEPTHYIALAGAGEPQGLGYALVQIPAGDWDGRPQTERAPTGLGGRAPDTALADLRQRLTESEGKADGLVRVSRAQSEEIEELRARLRRTAEARAELDEEVRRLRHALIEADESVVNLTRKTTEEMTSLAQRLTAGLRAGEPATPPASPDEVGRREREIAQRESALSERDDRIAALEAAKQEAQWRVDAGDDELDRTRAELASVRAEYQRALEQGQHQGELQAAVRARDLTIEEYRRAAAAHLEEVNRLRDAANEQGSLVAELEDELAACEKRQSTANAELGQLRKTLVDVESADRLRRSRLAELEGLMLRVEYTSAAASDSNQHERAELEALRARVAATTGEGDAIRVRLAETEGQLDALKAQLAAAENQAAALRTSLAETEGSLVEANASRARDGERLSELEKIVGSNEERQRRLAELHAEGADPGEIYERLYDLETQYQAATMAAARVPVLEAKLAELEARLEHPPQS